MYENRAELISGLTYQSPALLMVHGICIPSILGQFQNGIPLDEGDKMLRPLCTSNHTSPKNDKNYIIPCYPDRDVYDFHQLPNISASKFPDIHLFQVFERGRARQT